MRKFFSAYMAHKKITIPVTILVIGVIAGGIVFGVSATSSNKDNTTASASNEVADKKSNKANDKTVDKKSTVTASKNDKDSEVADKASDKKSTTTASKNDKNNATSSGKKPVSSNNSSNNSSGTSNPQKDIDDYIANNNANIEKNTPVQSCPTCGEKRKGRGAVFNDHDCPNTYDFYGNIVPKNSRYVEFVGGYGTKRYSDGTYEVTDEGRDLLRESYESELLIYQGAGIEITPGSRVSSLDAWVISHSGV